MATTHIPTPTPSAHHSTRSMALNLAEWMSDSLQSFGVQTYFDDGFWWRKPGGSGIYLGALNLDTQADNTALLADLQRVKAAWGGEEFSLYDCWGTYDLSVGGFERVVQNPWYLRPAGELATGDYQLPAGLSVARVATVAELIEFERASWVGFEESEEMLDSRPPFSWHPAATVENPNMHYLVARFAGQVVAGVIVQTSAGMLGIYDDQRKMKHAKQYARLGETIRQAVRSYIAEVEGGEFPTAEHSFEMAEDSLAELSHA